MSKSVIGPIRSYGFYVSCMTALCITSMFAGTYAIRVESAAKKETSCNIGLYRRTPIFDSTTIILNNLFFQLFFSIC